MRGRCRRLQVGVLAAGVIALVQASVSWACIFLAGITVSAGNVQPGGSVTVNGIGFGSNPVDLHLDTLTGPVLATVTPDPKGNFHQAVTVPQNAANGQHVLVAAEAAATPSGSNDGSAQGVPARAVFQVGTAAPAPAASPARPVQVDSTAGGGTLILIAVAVAVVGLLLAGLASLAASRSRRPAATAAT